MKNLNEMTTKELKEIAKELKVKNWWTIKKNELIKAIQFIQNNVEKKDEESIVEEEKTSPDKSSKKKRKQDLIEYNGKTQNLSQWARELEMPGQTLYARLYLSKWPVEKAFETPVRRKKIEEA